MLRSSLPPTLFLMLFSLWSGCVPEHLELAPGEQIATPDNTTRCRPIRPEDVRVISPLQLDGRGLYVLNMRGFKREAPITTRSASWDVDPPNLLIQMDFTLTLIARPVRPPGPKPGSPPPPIEISQRDNCLQFSPRPVAGERRVIFKQQQPSPACQGFQPVALDLKSDIPFKKITNITVIANAAPTFKLQTQDLTRDIEGYLNLKLSYSCPPDSPYLLFVGHPQTEPLIIRRGTPPRP